MKTINKKIPFFQAENIALHFGLRRENVWMFTPKMNKMFGTIKVNYVKDINWNEYLTAYNKRDWIVSTHDYKLDNKDWININEYFHL